jgi:hypothetical protein
MNGASTRRVTSQAPGKFFKKIFFMFSVMFSDSIYGVKPQGVFREGDNDKMGLKRYQMRRLCPRYVFFSSCFFYTLTNDLYFI